MTQYTYSDELYSDIHKDAYGFRPRDGGVHRWHVLTPAQKQEAWDYMEATIAEDIAAEKLREAEDLVEFEALIAAHIQLGAKDRETALRWMTQNELFHHQQDVEHFVWGLGILFTDEGRALVKELMEIVEFKEWEVS